MDGCGGQDARGPLHNSEDACVISMYSSYLINRIDLCFFLFVKCQLTKNGFGAMSNLRSAL